jgi:hypothetical protein
MNPLDSWLLAAIIVTTACAAVWLVVREATR